MTYLDLNAEVNLWDAAGKLQLHKDKEAARQYFREHVNENTVFFHDLEEKTEYLIENGYWNREVIERYPFEDFKALMKYTYGFKHRFDSLLGALKFYSSYALKNRDGSRYLERFEDRVVLNAVAYSEDIEHAFELAEAIITKRYQPATPTFMNAGRENWGAPVSCFLLRVEDNLESITRVQTDASQLSKRGGGVGILLSNIREEGSPIKGKNGVAKGVVPIMKILEDTFSYVDQLGQRGGAGVTYLSAHHPDIMTFLDTKRENADEKIRIKSLSLGVVIPDITFELAKNNEDMYLFSPYDVERVYGKPFSDISITDEYRAMVDNPAIRKGKVNARKFFQALAEVQFESGYPYIMFEDTANRANPAPNVGKISMSNLCVTGDTEILTSRGYRRADDLYESQEDFEVVVDERARTMKLNNTGTSIQKSSKMFKTAEDADVYLVKTVEGHEIKATEWHKFYVDRDGKLVKIPLAEMVPGDRILTQGAENLSWGEEHNPDLAYLAGVIASDGTFYQTRGGEYGVRIDLYGDKVQFKDQVEESVSAVLEGRDDLLHHSSSLEPKMVYSEQSDKWYLSSRPLAKILLEEGFTVDSKLKIPEFVKRGDRETQQQYVNGVWAMDGCITGSAKHSIRSFELGSINKDFLREMQQLLLQFGVYTRIYSGRKVASKNMLPDGKGGMKEYDVRPTWSLRANSVKDCSVLYDLVEWREFSVSRWEELKPQSRVTYRPHHKNRATVQSIEFYGVEDVYDPTVENGHSVIYNGLVTGNCSEIMQPQTPSTFNEAGEFETVGRDISCNLGSLNIDRVADLDEETFYRTIRAAYRMLNKVAEDSQDDLACSPSIQQGNGATRAIGLGQMNLHGALIKRGLKYDSEEARQFFGRYMADVTHDIIMSSSFKASDEQKSFDGYEGSRWQDGTMMDEMIAQLDKYPGTRYDKKDWDALKYAVMTEGLYNQHLQAIPPTGSISYVNGSTSSIHPITSKVEARKEGRVGRVYYPAYGLTDENFNDVQDAYEIGHEALIDMYAVAQPFVDQGMSMTLFFRDTATTRDLNKAQRYAHKAGVKSIYYIRMRNEVLSGTAMEECVSCSV